MLRKSYPCKIFVDTFSRKGIADQRFSNSGARQPWGLWCDAGGAAYDPGEQGGARNILSSQEEAKS